MSIKRLSDLDIRWIFNCGAGSNMKVELIGVWATLFLAKHLDIHHLQMLGDFKVVIEWMQRKGNLLATKIEGWKRRIQTLEGNFQDTLFQHIFRESNEEADNLSKRALESSKKGDCYFFTWDGEREGPPISLKIF
jgi:ribonuclease HI